MNDDAFWDAVSIETKARIEQDIWESLRDLTTTMADAGYNKDQYTVILQNYWSAIPPDSLNRYADTDFNRQENGGCPILDGDGDALNKVLLPAINDTVRKAAIRFRQEPYWPKIRLLDVSNALLGHRLCEKGVGLIEDIPGGTAKGPDLTSADKVEWVTEARSATVLGSPYTIAEGGHANYWGQLAERNCLRQMVTNGLLNSLKCVPEGGGVNGYGEPHMKLVPFTW
jgi:hypothetical protein